MPKFNTSHARFMEGATGDLDDVHDPLLPSRGRAAGGTGGDDFESLLTTHLISRQVEDRDDGGAPQLSQRMQVAEAMLLEREARGLIDEAPMNPQPSWKPEQQHMSARAEKRALKRKEFAALEQQEHEQRQQKLQQQQQMQEQQQQQVLLEPPALSELAKSVAATAAALRKAGAEAAAAAGSSQQQDPPPTKPQTFGFKIKPAPKPKVALIAPVESIDGEDGGDAPAGDGSSVPASSSVNGNEAATGATDESGSGDGGGEKRQRKSRWGTK